MKIILLLCIAALLLTAGLYLHFAGSMVPATDQQRCESIVADIYGDSDEAAASFADQCDQPGMVAMMDARANNLGAEEAADAISSANGGLIGTFLPYALIGAGIGALGGAFVAYRQCSGRQSKQA